MTAAVVVLSLFLVTILILCAVYYIRRRSVLKHSSKFLNHWILMSFSGKYIKNVFAISISYHFKFCCFMFWKTDYFLNTLINLYVCFLPNKPHDQQHILQTIRWSSVLIQWVTFEVSFTLFIFLWKTTSGKIAIWWHKYEGNWRWKTRKWG